jgi:hypothetical protein
MCQGLGDAGVLWNELNEELLHMPKCQITMEDMLGRIKETLAVECSGLKKTEEDWKRTGFQRLMFLRQIFGNLHSSSILIIGPGLREPK